MPECRALCSHEHEWKACVNREKGSSSRRAKKCSTRHRPEGATRWQRMVPTTVSGYESTISRKTPRLVTDLRCSFPEKGRCVGNPGAQAEKRSYRELRVPSEHTVQRGLKMNPTTGLSSLGSYTHTHSSFRQNCKNTLNQLPFPLVRTKVDRQMK